MVNFTSIGRKVLFSTLLCMFSFLSADAAVTKASDLFGTYKFTADLEIAEGGQDFSDVLKSECEVVITSHSVYDFSITGIGGSDGAQGGAFNEANSSIDLNNPNTSNYFLWGDRQLCMANVNGDFPFGKWDDESWQAFEVSYTFDADTKTITIPDFTAVRVDWGGQTATVIATFRNCKLTLQNSEVIAVNDISGQWTFTAGEGEYSSNPESAFPKTFVLGLTATDETCTKYDANITFEGYAPVVLQGVNYDGAVLYLPYNDTYIGDGQSLVFTDINMSSRQGVYTFNKSTDNVMTLSSGMAIGRIEGENRMAEQWYTDGTLKREGAEVVDYAGTYDINVGYAFVQKEDVPYPQEGGSFTLTISKSDYNGKYYVTEFMGEDVNSLNYGGIPCEETENGLEIAVGTNRFLRSVEVGVYYDVLMDGTGADIAPIKFEVAADGTVQMGDFFIKRMNFNDFEAEPEMCAYYSQLTGKKATTGISNTVAGGKGISVYAAGKEIRVKGGKAAVEVFAVSGACVYRGVTDRVVLPAGGIYVVKCGGKTVKVAL